MVLDLIVDYIIANSSVPDKTSTPTHISAFKQKQKDWISNVSKSNNWHTQCISCFQNLLFLNQDNIL